ncbi:MAG: hypothetical protein VX436_02735 [Planctomycetota bacterium]|nr:hypothetical protein [Planctomycetota bacterium]
MLGDLMRLLSSAFTILVLAVFSTTVEGYPKATDKAKRWQFTLDTGDLRFYRDWDTGEGYWLLVYEVTNETKSDRHWIPSFDLVTDRGEIIPDGDGVRRKVQLDLLKLFADPLMVAQSDASGPLLQGEENAIRGLLIWKARSEKVKEVQVFASGVSGDTADVIHPITGDKHKLHRVLQLSWYVDGGLDQIELKPLPKRPVSGGTSVRRLSTDSPDGSGGDDVERKWIFR